MGGHWLGRGGLAAGTSAVLHLLLAASGLSWLSSEPSAPEVTTVELIPLSLSPQARPPPPPIEPEEPPEPPPPTPNEPRPRAPVQRPMLAAKLSSTTVDRAADIPSRLEPVPDEPEPPPEPPEPPPEPPEPRPLPELPSPREAAQRHVAEGIPPAPTDREVVEARVLGMMREALPPRLDDDSPMPELHPDGQGNLIHENGALSATIAPDGSVSFQRRRGIAVEGVGSSENPDPDQQELLDLFTRIPGVPLVVREASPGDCARGRCQDKVGLGLTFRPHSDFNDAILRWRGEDPLAARKRRFLRLTRDMRDRMADEHRGRALKMSKLRASRHLERIWADPSLGFNAKRRLLFDLWDEAEEPAGEEDERPEARAGQRARRFIQRFIREHLPPDGPEAFTPTELDALNARRSSRQRFEPY